MWRKYGVSGRRVQIPRFVPWSVADLGGEITSLKVTILAKKSASVSNNSAPFRDASPPTDLNVTNPAKNQSQFWWRPFFLFFFLETTWIWAKKTVEFPTSAEKSLSILVKTSEFLRFCASNPPPPKFSGSATGHDAFILRQSNIHHNFETGRYNGILLGDSGYPLKPWLLTPISAPSSPAAIRYNQARKRCRSIVDK